MKTGWCHLLRIICWLDPSVELLWVLWLAVGDGVSVKQTELMKRRGKCVWVHVRPSLRTPPKNYQDIGHILWGVSPWVGVGLLYTCENWFKWELVEFELLLRDSIRCPGQEDLGKSSPHCSIRCSPRCTGAHGWNPMALALCGPWAGSISSAWELIKSAASQTLFPTYQIRICI